MDLFQNREMTGMSMHDARDYKEALMDLLVRTKGNRRVARELFATLTYLESYYNLMGAKKWRYPAQ